MIERPVNITTFRLFIMDPHFVPSIADSDNDDDWEEIETTQVQPKTLEITLNPQPKIKEMKRFGLFPLRFLFLFTICVYSI